MKAIKSIFSLNYSPKLMALFAKQTPFGTFYSNVITPVVLTYLLHESIPNIQLGVWFFLNILLFGIRVILSKKLYKYINISYEKVKQLIIVIIFSTTSSGLLLGYIIWAAVLYKVDDQLIFIIALAIVSLTTGAITTLVSIYVAYLSYVFVSIISMVSAILYHGGELFTIFAIILLFLMSTILVTGYKQVTLLRDTISMEDTFRTIFEKSADGIMIMKDNSFIDCNEAFVDMFRFPSKKELLELGPIAIMPKYQTDGLSSMDKMSDMIYQAQHEGSRSFEWLHYRHDGEWFWAEIVLTKIYLHDIEVLHGTWRDISERKHIDEERKRTRDKIESLNRTLEQRVAYEVEKNREMDHHLMQQSRLAQMGEMISMIAHQWRQPLSAISVTSGSIAMKAKKQTLDFETSIELSDKISTYSQHLSETINDFRNFFKPHTGKGETNYDDIIEAAMDIIGVSISNKDIKIEQDLQCHASFACYPNELKQVLLNLLKNAEDALIEKKPESAFIKMTTYTDQGKYILEISDNAGGIKEQNLKSIFDPYFSTKSDKNGTGLGLYMSKRIIEDHCNGILSVHNDSQGAVFTIKLTRNGAN